MLSNTNSANLGKKEPYIQALVPYVLDFPLKFYCRVDISASLATNEVNDAI